jgi:hypothetical protein
VGVPRPGQAAELDGRGQPGDELGDVIEGVRDDGPEKPVVMAEDAQLGFRPGDDLFDGLGDGSGPLLPHFPGGAAGQEPAIQQTEQALGPWVGECDTRHLRKPPHMLSVPGWRYGSTNVGGLEFLGVAGINYLIILSSCRR